MDEKQLVEFYTGLYIKIENEYEKVTAEGAVTQVINMIFEQTCKRIISDLIGKQRQGVPAQQSAPSSDKPTEKQIKWATDLGCHKPEGFSRKELSAWIMENK